MLHNPVRVAEAIRNCRFRAGDAVVLSQGPHKFVAGKFLHLNEDVEWASIEQSDGILRSHPVEWMEHAANQKGGADQ